MKPSTATARQPVPASPTYSPSSGPTVAGWIAGSGPSVPAATPAEPLREEYLGFLHSAGRYAHGSAPLDERFGRLVVERNRVLMRVQRYRAQPWFQRWLLLGWVAGLYWTYRLRLADGALIEAQLSHLL